MNKINRKWLIIFLIGIILCIYAQQAESRDIILKSIVVNPSKTKTQKATLKAYLPREAKPEDILELGDLKVNYDVIEGLFYVYKQVELKPGESLLRKVTIRDVWIISEEELQALAVKAKEIAGQLKDSNFLEAAVKLSEDIEERQTDIINTQSEARDALPAEHIAVYRENEEKLDKIKENLAKLEKMFLEYKLAKGRVGPVSVKVSWFVILSVIIALGVISFVFFIIWHKQAGVLKSSRQKLEGEEKLP